MVKVLLKEPSCGESLAERAIGIVCGENLAERAIMCEVVLMKGPVCALNSVTFSVCLFQVVPGVFVQNCTFSRDVVIL